MKHVRVASRIGDDKALDAGNSHLLPSRATRSAAILDATLLGLARVLAHGIVASHLLRMTKLRVLLRALSQNRDSASRVS
jgi:hypothetical protein